MKIAVPYDDGAVFQHFGHSAFFKIYDVENGQIAGSEVVAADGQGHGALASFLKSKEVATLICGGIGGCARTALKDAHIALYGGVTGSADEAVSALLAGTLVFDPNANCASHGHAHGDGHSCGGHSCGGH